MCLLLLPVSGKPEEIPTAVWRARTMTVVAGKRINYYQQGGHSSWKVMEFSKTIIQAWKVMENSEGHGKSWKMMMMSWIFL